MTKKEWHKIRENIQTIYYHCKPHGTVCIASVVMGDETHTARGVSIVHPNDNFCRRIGRAKALGWAEKALYHDRDMCGKTRSWSVLDTYAQITARSGFIYVSGSSEELPHIRTYTAGYANPALTPFEKEILAKKKTREIKIEESKNGK